jgi:hypothetical protein
MQLLRKSFRSVQAEEVHLVLETAPVSDAGEKVRTLRILGSWKLCCGKLPLVRVIPWFVLRHAVYIYETECDPLLLGNIPRQIYL